MQKSSSRTKLKGKIELSLSLNSNTPLKKVWQQPNLYKNRRQSNTHISVYIYPLEFDTKVDQELLKPFTGPEIDRVMKQNNNKAPGKDKIHYSMLYNLHRESKKILLNILNSIFAGRVATPLEWYDYVVIPILKPGKPENHVDSYRPIALSSCVLKTYERLIKNRLEYHLEKAKLM
nr:unnamed protein product [Callosobruchus chinensis]